jgi:hypothetical protein
LTILTTALAAQLAAA